VEWLTQLLSDHGAMILYIGTFAVLILCGLGVPFPEEATFLAAGYACKKIGGDASVEILCVIGVLGIMGGDSIPFWVGRKYGMSVLTHRFFKKFLPPHRIAQVQKFFTTQGARTVFIARFVAGLRMPTFFMAGTMGIKYRTFFMYDLAGALISCPTSIYLAWRFGTDAERMIKENHTYLFIALGLVVAYIVFHVVTHKDKVPPPQETPTVVGTVPEALPPATPAPSVLPVKTPEVQS